LPNFLIPYIIQRSMNYYQILHNEERAKPASLGFSWR